MALNFCCLAESDFTSTASKLSCSSTLMEIAKIYYVLISLRLLILGETFINSRRVVISKLSDSSIFINLQI